MCYYLSMFRKNIEDDTTLVEACIGRDTAAWAHLVKKYSSLISGSIVNCLKKYGFNPLCEETEDIRQNILAIIWEGAKLEGVRNRRSIAHWLSIISQNVTIEYMRKKLGKETLKLVPIFDVIDPQSLDLVYSSNSGDCDGQINKELSEKITSSIESLPPRERLIIKMNLLNEMKYYEISEMLNIPKGTVSSYIKRAKEKLRDDLKDFKQF